MNIFVNIKIVEAIVCYPLLVSEKVKGLSAEVNDLFIRGCGEVEKYLARCVCAKSWGRLITKIVICATAFDIHIKEVAVFFKIRCL